MTTTGWLEDPSVFCAHAETSGWTIELAGHDGPVPTERCLGCRAVRLLVPRPDLRVVARAEPLEVRKASFPEPKGRKGRWWLPFCGSGDEGTKRAG